MSGAAPPPPAPPSYEIVDTPDGLFDLARRAGTAPTDAETELAKRIRRVLDVKREQIRAGAQPSADFARDLRAVAQCGLIDTPARPVVAGLALVRLENSLNGPFIVGTLTRDAMLAMRRNLAHAEMTDDQRAFTTEIDQQERLIRSLFEGETPDQGLGELLQRVRSAAVIGLMDNPADVRLARFAMAGVMQDAMRQRGQKARASYLNRLLGAYAERFLQVAFLLFLFWGLQKLWPPGFPAFPPSLAIGGEKLLLLGIAIGSVFVGAWLSAVVRLQPDSAEVLDGIYTNTFTAPLRSLFILGFGVLALLLLYKKVVVVSFGAEPAPLFTSGMVLEKLSAAILVGAFLGLGESALPNAVIQRSSGLLSALGTGGAPPAR